MKTILFFDDWLLDAKRNIERRFISPEPIGQETTFEGSATTSMSLSGRTTPTPTTSAIRRRASSRCGTRKRGSWRLLA